MGKYFKDQELTYTKKRFKQSTTSNKNIREAGIIDVAPKIFQGMKNAFSFLMKMNKSVKFDPAIVTKLESEFLKDAATFNQAIAKHKAARDLAQQELDDIAAGAGKYANLSQPQKANLIKTFTDDLNNAKRDLQSAQISAESKLGTLIDDFNDSNKFPITLELGRDASGGITLSHGILSKGAGDAIDIQGLGKALGYLRGTKPASEGGLERLVTVFRGLKGNFVDSANFLRDMSKNPRVSGLLNQKYVFAGPANAKGFRPEKSFTLIEIMEQVARDGKFIPPKGFSLVPGQQNPAEDFNRLTGIVTASQSGIRNPMAITGLSAMGTAIKVGLTAPFILPIGQKAVENVKNYWRVDERIRSQEQTNAQQSGASQNEVSPQAKEAQLLEEQRNNLLREIEYARQQQRVSPNESMRDFWYSEEQRSLFELQNLGK